MSDKEKHNKKNAKCKCKSCKCDLKKKKKIDVMKLTEEEFWKYVTSRINK